MAKSVVDEFMKDIDEKNNIKNKNEDYIPTFSLSCLKLSNKTKEEDIIEIVNRNPFSGYESEEFLRCIVKYLPVTMNVIKYISEVTGGLFPELYLKTLAESNLRSKGFSHQKKLDTLRKLSIIDENDNISLLLSSMSLNQGELNKVTSLGHSIRQLRELTKGGFSGYSVNNLVKISIDLENIKLVQIDRFINGTIFSIEDPGKITITTKIKLWRSLI